MAQSDWKRYFGVMVEDLKTGDVRIFSFYCRNRSTADSFVSNLRRNPRNGLRVMGIARIRGNKRNPGVQRWLAENAI